ncbi:MAG TPA: YbjN domain-containing protein [Acidimicrobiales bacterium]
MPAASPEELDALESAVDGWLQAMLAEHESLVAVDRAEPGERRWYVRMAGETKDFTTVWLTLGQRALHIETYLMPAPEENEAELYAHLLLRNREARGLWLCIGDEDAVYLVGQLPIALVDEANLDRVLGSAYSAVEQWFRPALRIGFASRFGG